MPRYGFNFQWMYSYGHQEALPADEKALDFMAEMGFTFLRLPMDYRFWCPNFDYLHPDESVLTNIDGYIAAAKARKIHVCLNFHRAPGYCINRNDLEKHNLWLDPEPQEGFAHQWAVFARRYADISPEDLSFDLVNEPANIGQYGLTRENHAAIMRRTAAAIWAIDPDRPITIDGLGGGNIAMPELADLGATHSGRGYQPMNLTHYKAQWWADHTLYPDPPEYPGTRYDNITWNRQALVDYYAPWRKVQEMGAPVHIGEFGCYDKVDNEVALRWFADLFSVYKEFGWGYSLWGFEGAFGIIGHGRPNTKYETYKGFENVDRRLADLLLGGRV